MRKISKAYSLKIILLVANVLFFINTTAHSLTFPDRTQLRVPLQDKSRFQKVLTRRAARRDSTQNEELPHLQGRFRYFMRDVLLPKLFPRRNPEFDDYLFRVIQKERYSSIHTLFSVLGIFYPEKSYQICCVYAYLRYVDDIVDSKDIESEQKEQFLSEQKQMLQRWFFDRAFDDRELDINARILKFTIEEYPDFAKKIRRHVVALMETMEYDFYRQRERTIFPEDEIRAYNEKVLSAVFQIVFISMTGEEIVESEEFLKFCAEYSELGTLQDLEDDIKSGIIGISLEDNEQYQIFDKEGRVVFYNNLRRWFYEHRTKVKNQLKKYIIESWWIKMPTPIRIFPRNIIAKIMMKSGMSFIAYRGYKRASSEILCGFTISTDSSILFSQMNDDISLDRDRNKELEYSL